MYTTASKPKKTQQQRTRSVPTTEESTKNTEIPKQKDTYFKGVPAIPLKDYNIYVLCGIDLKIFMRDIVSYPINNPIDHHHSKEIEEGIKQITTLDNCINVVEYNDGTIQILDGQHRQRALNNILDSELLTKEVVIHLYRSDNALSEKTAKLFNRFNTVKPFKINHDVTDAGTEIIKRLQRDCKGFGPNSIKNTKCDSARQPAMSMKEFSGYIEPFLGELGPGNYIISDIVKYIDEINQEFAVICDREHPDRLFKSDPVKNAKKKEDMRRIQFYLNTELSKSVWIEMLKEKLRISNAAK